MKKQSSAFKKLGAPVPLAVLIVVLSTAFATAGENHEDSETPVTSTRQYNNPNIKGLKYEYVNHARSEPLYEIILNTMQPDLKGTDADRTSTHPINPSLNIAKFDLNNDGLEEIIAVPIENTEGGNYCGGNYLRCPHYILDVSGDKAEVIGVIKAFAIDRGDEIKNGYWTLKAFTDSKLPERDPQIDIYSHSKKQKIFVKDTNPS